MVTLEQIKALVAAHPDKRFYVHDGFHGFGYGIPFSPTLIAQETAMHLLNRIAAQAGIDVLSDVQRVLPPLQYAEKGLGLYEHRRKNRFIVFVEEDRCIIEKKRKARKEHSFDIQGAA